MIIRGLRTIFDVRIMVGVFIALALALALFLWMLVHRPGWWSSAGDRSSASAAIGAGLEQAVSREITMVREPGEWGFVLGEGDINAWLVNRLEPWLQSRRDLAFPEGLSDPRIRLGDDWIEVGLLAEQAGLQLFTSARFELRLENDDLVLLPIEGRLAFKTFDREALAYLEDHVLGDVEGEIDSSSGGLRVPAVITLADGRRVILTDLEMAAGELGVRFRTLGP